MAISMSMRGAATAFIGAQIRNQSLTSIPQTLKLGSRSSPSQIPHRFPSFPVYQTGYNKFSVRAIQEATADPIAPKKKDEGQKDWKIKMLYDGDCPLCLREVNMLRERNKSYGTINFVDISSDEYSPEENQGLEYKTVMGNIHAILSDGTVVTDVEAFRKLYEQVGLGWVYAITKYEPVEKVAKAVYGVWAKYRLQITGRPPIEEILESRNKKKGKVCGDANDCKI